ncbi:SAM-dependent methyltransferase [Saccharothrix sp. 6-C]|uniref:SAM-dependent methyltransferase n=1 Tax=Saccharothrix sp. 6-C TaxID=2781735 RepID=UPI0019175E97|nr:SAM-dependent methyltransferase [Saccharothrix sp. 6-C]QQQ79542.1 SAM-dependent methyltransferase [Saccharothrix sp. 6-C]
MTTDLDAVEKTCLLTAALRAAETRRADRLYEDPFAERLAGGEGADLLAEITELTHPADGTPRRVPSTIDYNAIRTRFFDDFLLSAVADPALTQVVLAPVGMDARAYRLGWPPRVRVFEVDRPAVLAVKHHRLGDALPLVDRRPVELDMVEDDWAGPLLAAGYDPAAPSVWLLEGLLYYIPEAAVHRVLDHVRSLTAPGSLVAGDIVNAVSLSSPRTAALLRVFARWGCPWLFGADDPEALFDRHGFAVDAAQPGEEGAGRGRWPDPVVPRAQPDVERVFLVSGRRREG